MLLPANRLTPGDYLPATRETVTASPVRGLTTPPGKVELVLSGERGPRAVTWRSSTQINVTRKTATA